MKYVIMKDDKIGEAIKLGRFGGKLGYALEIFDV